MSSAMGNMCLGMARTALETNSSQQRGMTPIHTAVANGQPELVKIYLMQDRNQIAWQDHLGNTPLHIAVYRRDYSMVQLILDFMKRFGPLIIINSNGNTPIHMAIESRQFHIARLLLTNARITGYSYERY